LDVDNGAGGNTVTFYTSTNDPSTNPTSIAWTPLGAPVVNAGTTSIFAGTANLDYGAAAGGTANLFTGQIYRAQVYNGIFGAGGTLAADFNPQAVITGSTSFQSAATGETYTVNGAGSIAGSYVPGVPGSNPQIMLRFSDDGGYTWNGPFDMPAGQLGQTSLRVIQNRLGGTTIGGGLDRVWEASSIDPFAVKIIGAEWRGGPS
jgi:hypothetical protein